MFRVIRVLRIVRVAPFIQRLRGIRRLVRVMRSCFWTLVNIGLLLLILLICFAFIGMQLFSNVAVPQAGVLDDMYNVRIAHIIMQISHDFSLDPRINYVIIFRWRLSQVRFELYGCL